MEVKFKISGETTAGDQGVRLGGRDLGAVFRNVQERSGTFLRADLEPAGPLVIQRAPSFTKSICYLNK